MPNEKPATISVDHEQRLMDLENMVRGHTDAIGRMSDRLDRTKKFAVISSIAAVAATVGGVAVALITSKGFDRSMNHVLGVLNKYEQPQAAADQ